MKQRHEKYFIKSKNSSNFLKFIAKQKKAEECHFLIDGKPSFKAMEAAMWSAKETIFLSFWTFHPLLPLLNIEAKKEALKEEKSPPRCSKWIDLFSYKASKGVKIYIIVCDFDPILVPEEHYNAWTSYAILRKLQRKLSFQFRKNLHFMSVKQEAHGSAFWYQSTLKEQRDSLIDKLNKMKEEEARAKFRLSPGLWKYIRFNPKQKAYVATEETLTIHVGSHHNKYCVVDQSVVVAGGLDAHTKRIDQEHKKKVPWHDIDIRVKGYTAADVTRHFVGMWNHYREKFNTFIKGANALTDNRIDYTPVEKLRLSILPPPKKVHSQTYAQSLRTLSVEGTVYPNKNVRDDIMKAYKQVIETATQYIYIESQYFRFTDLGNWILKRCKKVPELVFILVIPVAPEEVPNDPKQIDPITNHGLYLQSELLKKLSAKLRHRFGAYSMVKKELAKEKHISNSYNRNQVYVHSKTLIVDDQYALVGSANANGRSFLLDTELGIGVHAPSKVRRFRLKLWNEHLGHPNTLSTWKPRQFVANWNRIARNNTVLSAQKGFIVPQKTNKGLEGKKDGTYDTYAELFDPKPDTSLA